MESREDFYFDDSDNPGSDATIEKEEHYKWTIALEEETKEDAVIPEEDLFVKKVGNLCGIQITGKCLR